MQGELFWGFVSVSVVLPVERGEIAFGVEADGDSVCASVVCMVNQGVNGVFETGIEQGGECWMPLCGACGIVGRVHRVLLRMNAWVLRVT